MMHIHLSALTVEASEKATILFLFYVSIQIYLLLNISRALGNVDYNTGPLGTEGNCDACFTDSF